MIKTLVPAGTYFLGDPCYAVPNDLWSDLLESCDYFDGSSFGKVTVNLKEYKVLAFNTAYGDGVYSGSDGVEYGVDAGLIGLTPIELCTDEDFEVDLGTIITFDEPTVCTNENGLMRFGNVSIDTSYECDVSEDDDYYDERYEDEGDTE